MLASVSDTLRQHALPLPKRLSYERNLPTLCPQMVLPTVNPIHYVFHDDAMNWKHLSHDWHFARIIHPWFSQRTCNVEFWWFICCYCEKNCWKNICVAGNLKADYDEWRNCMSPLVKTLSVMAISNKCDTPWWSQWTETFSKLLAFYEGNSPVSEFVFP